MIIRLLILEGLFLVLLLNLLNMLGEDNMSSLSVFLNPVKEENKKVIVTKRYLDEEGNPVPFEIRAITQAENKKLMKKHTKRDKRGIEVFNRAEYMAEFVASAVVFPDLNNA